MATSERRAAAARGKQYDPLPTDFVVKSDQDAPDPESEATAGQRVGSKRFWAKVFGVQHLGQNGGTHLPG